jgi:hypothetical protein
MLGPPVFTLTRRGVERPLPLGGHLGVGFMAAMAARVLDVTLRPASSFSGYAP